MDDRAAELANAFEGRRQVADREVGEGGGVARTRPALVDPKAKAVILDLPSRACFGGSWDELGAQHTAPETASAIGVVSGELDQRDQHQPEYAFIPTERNASPTAALPGDHAARRSRSTIRAS
jgi:hypothetical protein